MDSSYAARKGRTSSIYIRIAVENHEYEYQ